MEKKKDKKPFYKKWWFWLIVVFVLIIILSGGNTDSNSSNTKKTYEKTKNKVSVVDLSSMTSAERDTWCQENKINCSTKEDYSDTISKGEFISQSVVAGKTIYEGESIVITVSLGKKPTTEQLNALKKAESYSKIMHMSKKGIYEQLTSEYGEGFDADAAQYAIDNINADWNANALEKAKDYRDTMSMSKSAIYDQLISEYGEKFTASEAQYAIDHLDD